MMPFLKSLFYLTKKLESKDWIHGKEFETGTQYQTSLDFAVQKLWAEIDEKYEWNPG